MRLPENKESRQKVLALIALGVVGVAYGIWVGVYDPLRRGRDEAKVKIVQMEEDLQAARVQIQRTGETRKELQGVVRDLLMHSEKEMLQPRLGNYLLQAREILTEAGKAAGVQYFSVTEVGLVDLPLQPKKTNTVSVLSVRAYSARVTAECGTDALVEWLALLEKGNPLISVSHITISAQPESVQRHVARFEVQWPVWIDPAMRERVIQQAAELDEEKPK